GAWLMRVIDLNRKPGEPVKTHKPSPLVRPRQRPPFVPAREAACKACEHQAVESFTELCDLRREWGCLGKARWAIANECPGGKWPKTVNLKPV
ncbi:MAG TPA: hypothetical protein PKJ78_22770, partial [Candidatus Hydrogenedentes bacterium]|nr:hypothetical protein [Candidatus Hydrogenedentota bacterium]